MNIRRIIRVFLAFQFIVALTDLSAQWKKIASSPIPNVTLPSTPGITYLYNNHGTIWASCNGGWSSASHSVLYSQDTGRTWVTKFTNASATFDFFDSLNGTMILIDPVTAYAQIQRTTDAGSTWNTLLAPPNPYIWSLIYAGSVKNIILIAGYNYGKPADIYTSTDTGTTWLHTLAPHGVSTLTRSSTGMIAFVTGVGDSGKHIIYVWRSLDSGLTWKETSTPTYQPLVYDVDQIAFDNCKTSRLIFPSGRFIYITDDFGASVMKNTLPVPAGGEYYVNNALSQSQNAIFCQMYDNPPTILNSGIQRSTDGGSNWLNIHGPGNGSYTQTVCAINNNIIIAVDENGDVWRTDNCGGDPLDSPPPQFEARQIVMNECSRDSLTVVITGLSCRKYHIRSFNLRGADISQLSIAPHAQPFVLSDGASDSLWIRLDSKLKLGRIRDSVKITYYEEGDMVVHDTTIWFPFYINPLPPNVVADVTGVFFGSTKNCTQRDKIIQLKNNGCDTLLITAAPKFPPGIFYDALKLPLAISPGSAVNVQIHFRPAISGGFDGSAHFTAYHKGLTQSVDIPVTGVGSGTYESLSFSDTLIEFLPISRCIPQRDTIIRFVNNSCETLKVFSGPDSLTGEFTSETLFPPVILQPNEAMPVRLFFSSPQKGEYSSDLYFSGEIQGKPFRKKFSLTGKNIGDDPNPSIKDSLIKFHRVTNCSPIADTLIPFSNRGCDTLKVTSVEVTNPEIFSADSSSLPLTVPPEGTANLHFTFHPGGVTGSFESGVNLLVAQKTITRLFKLSLNGRSVDLSNPGPTVEQTEYYFDSTSIFGGRKDTTITFTNEGCDDLQIISGPASVGEGFSWDQVTLPHLLASNESMNMTFHFQPKRTGQYRTTLNFTTERSGKQQRIDLYFEGYGIEGRSTVEHKPVEHSSDGVLILSIHPNPAQDEITIDVVNPGGQMQSTPTVFDALGAEVYSEIRNLPAGQSSIHLPIHDLAQGVYFVRVGDVGMSFVKMK
jgi:photosystem II stability/assembly factor-like uncharacterized protein